MGIPHELAELVNLANSLVQLVAASVGLAAALAVRRRMRDSRQNDDGRRDNGMPD
ncbi:hypothetical protein [Micromonospora sp. KC606]|uniref:hypothetical protein n=1 Tax=Micromonospora sp. KC606 TaxID=2530379 RepID=UPI001404A739|nr:hypothetical protein [Micromonospora sp. KC606]